MSVIFIDSFTPGGIVKNGLVLHLDAAQPSSYPGSGITWTDLTGNGINGTLTNMDSTNFNSTNGGFLTFNGNDEFVDCGNSSALDFTNNLTLSAWFYRNGFQPSTDSGIAGKIQETGGYKGYMLWYNSNTVDFYFNNGTKTNSTTFINSNTWYNVVGTYNGATSSIYINGTLDASANTTVSIDASTSNFNVGKYVVTSTSSSRHFAGRISNVLAYNRALSAAEVTQNFNALKSRFGL